MTDFDKQRIENANWIIQRYSDELEDTNCDIVIGGVYVTPKDALRVLNIAVECLIKRKPIIY